VIRNSAQLPEKNTLHMLKNPERFFKTIFFFSKK
jgi:hypothetical protein